MHWLDEKTLAPLFEVNERVLELLPCGVPGARVRLTDKCERERVARCPVLLVEAGLQAAHAWSSGGRAGEAFFSQEDAVPLMRMTLVLAWSMARMSRDVACVVLGVSLKDASFIAGLGLGEIHRIAEERWWSVRPRWLDRPGIWQRLVLAETRAAVPPGVAVGLRSMQLLFWEFVQSTRGESAAVASDGPGWVYR